MSHQQQIYVKLLDGTTARFMVCLQEPAMTLYQKV
jgi:hypothetical protein